MYTRTVNGKELEFGVSGKLYKDALVMFDRETDSLWTQVDGTVLRGEFEGAQLETIPITHTTWKEWKRLHPDTLVLLKGRNINSSGYAGYNKDPKMFGLSGLQDPDKRVPGKSLVVSLRDGVDALALPVERLKKNPLHQTTLNGRPIVVIWNPGSRTAAVYESRVNGEDLDFYVAGQGRILKLRDKQTGTVWNGLTGAAEKGELRDQQLEPVQYMVNFWWAWTAYNPHTRVEP